MQIKPAYVAGHFYPKDAIELQQMINKLLADAENKNVAPPKAIIAPHAGYIYSGQTAAAIYATLKPLKNKIKKVVLLGPAHRVPVIGIAATKVDSFATPLGTIMVDHAIIQKAINLSFVNVNENAYFMEHCLEVQLPFLQTILEDFSIAPFVVGSANPTDVAKMLQEVWGSDDTLIVISSDLSHYHDYQTAINKDTATSNAITELQPFNIKNDGACGRIPIQGLLLAAKDKDLKVTMLDLRNSGDTAGDKNRVVGYGAYHVG